MVETMVAAVLNTAHITPEAALYIEGEIIKGDMATTEIPEIVGMKFGKYGYIVFVDTEFDHEAMPESLVDVLEWAVSNNFEWVRFDRDAKAVEDLHVYEWP